MSKQRLTTEADMHHLKPLALMSSLETRDPTETDKQAAKWGCSFQHFSLYIEGTNSPFPQSTASHDHRVFIPGKQEAEPSFLNLSFYQ